MQHPLLPGSFPPAQYGAGFFISCADLPPWPLASPPFLGTYSTVGRVDFGLFWIFNLYKINLDWQNNSMIKVETASLFIFMSSYAEMCFWGLKK
jgi:hypothetical protein